MKNTEDKSTSRKRTRKKRGVAVVHEGITLPPPKRDHIDSAKHTNLADNRHVAQSSREQARLVERTVAALRHARLPLDMPGSIELNELRSRLITQLEARILPHMGTRPVPVVVVMVGSTGAGKSTLVNSLMGEEISPTSVIRPTTRQPVIAVHPVDVPSLERHALAQMGQVAVCEGAIPGMVIVDAPDLDSVELENRDRANRLLDAADLCLFVTTAARYGDGEPWRVLTDAYRRGATVAVVLNRVADAAVRAVRQDLVDHLAAEQMGDMPIIVVPDAGPHEGLLPRAVIHPIRVWLYQVATPAIGAALVQRTTDFTLPEIRRGLLDVAEAVEHQANALQDLADQVSLACSVPLEKLTTNAQYGRFGQGAAAATWASFAAEGAVLSPLVAAKKPGMLARKSTDSRDEAVTLVYQSAAAAIRVALHQGIVNAEEAVRQAWSNDIVETDAFADIGRSAMRADAWEDEAMRGWDADLRALAARGTENPWLSREGMARLLGAGAAGVSGAVRSLENVGLSGVLGEARESLAGRLENALAHVMSAYQQALEAVSVGNGRQLRVRAKEFLDRM